MVCNLLLLSALPSLVQCHLLQQEVHNLLLPSPLPSLVQCHLLQQQVHNQLLLTDTPVPEVVQSSAYQTEDSGRPGSPTVSSIPHSKFTCQALAGLEIAANNSSTSMQDQELSGWWKSTFSSS